MNPNKLEEILNKITAPPSKNNTPDKPPNNKKKRANSQPKDAESFFNELKLLAIKATEGNVGSRIPAGINDISGFDAPKYTRLRYCPMYGT